MKPQTLQRANKLTSELAELKTHKQEVEAAIKANKANHSPFTNTLGLMRNNGNPTISLRSSCLLMGADKLMDLYIKEVDEKLAKLQAEFDNLTDDNCPEPGKSTAA